MNKTSCHIMLLVLLLVFLLPARKCAAEIDPERRTNMEIGFAGPVHSNGPLGGYGLLLFNRPHIFNEDTYLLAIVSPYLYTEIIRDKWPSPGQAIGMSIGGGFLNNDFDQVRDGSYKRDESFRGDGADAALSYYLRPPPIGGLMPVDGVLRISSRFARYQHSGDTDPRYLLPEDSFIHAARVGVRIGGVPPELLPEKALEFSLWHEANYRVDAPAHGLPARLQPTEHLTQQTWGRLGGIMPVWLGHTASLMMSAGMSGHTDELSCYRLGSGLRFQDEFPYILHGYYFRELFARSFFLLNTSYRFAPVPDLQNVQLRLNYDYSQISYLSGHELPRTSLNGLGIDLILLFAKNVTLTTGYGYGVDAPRHGGFGGHQVNVMFEWKL